MIDHHVRKRRLEQALDNLHRVRDEWQDDYEDLSLDGEIPCVPQRYLIAHWEGDDTWVTLHDTLDEAKDACLGDSDQPSSPGNVLDLDTGQEWEPVHSVELKLLDTRVVWSYLIDVTGEGDMERIEGEHMLAADEAQAWIDQYRSNGEGYEARIAAQ